MLRRRGARHLAATGTAFLLLAVTIPVLAWNDSGHLLMARLTFARLSAAERTALVETLEHHPRFQEDFLSRLPVAVRRAGSADEWLVAQASVWPDTVRRFDHVGLPSGRDALIDRYHHGPWHYVNIVLEVDAMGAYLAPLVPVRILAAPTAPGPGNIIEALETLTSGWPAASATDRAVALCWILHLMADLHQPLHTVTLVAPGTLARGDRGGNDIGVTDAGKAGSNLHAIWDSALGRTTSWSAVGRMVAELLEHDVESAPNEIDFDRWAIESAALARSVAYPAALRQGVAAQSAAGERPSTAVGAAYLRDRTVRAQTQIVRSAQRAATVLRALPIVTRAAR